MSGDIIILLLIFCTLLIIAYHFYKQNTHFHTATYAIMLYTFSSAMSILFFFQPLAHINGQFTGNLSLWPAVYWITIFLITLIPLIQFDKSKTKSFKYNNKLFKNVAVFGFIVSIVPFVEQMMSIPALLGGDNFDLANSAMVEMHDNASLDSMSFLGRNGLRLNIAIYDLSFLILMTQFLQKKRSKFMMFCLFFIIITRNLTGIIAGHRSSVIEVVMKVVLIATIAYPLMEEKQKKAMRSFTFCLFSIVSVIFAIITIGRQMIYSVTKSADFTMTYFLSWYAGEGLVNFNQYLPVMKKTTGGEYTCWTFLHILGLNPHEIDSDYMYGHLTRLQGIPQNIFYTYIGTFVQDFGFMFTAIILIASALGFRYVTYNRGAEMPISKLYLFVFYSSIILQGVTSFCYSGDHGKFIIWSLLIYAFLRYHKI